MDAVAGLWDCAVDEMLLCEYLPLVLGELPKGKIFFFILSSLGEEDHLVVKGYAINWFK